MSDWQAWTTMSGGPERVVTNEPNPNFKRRPVGFATQPPPEREPQLWEGDNA